MPAVSRVSAKTCSPVTLAPCDECSLQNRCVGRAGAVVRGTVASERQVVGSFVRLAVLDVALTRRHRLSAIHVSRHTPIVSEDTRG